jgi:hypothetical protein
MSYQGAERGVGAAASIRLEPGKHRSADDGVCVVELASMIGGERFSDRPDCVCDVIAAFLRSWNDRVGYVDRQRLEPYASRVVGTGGYRRISRMRRDLCLTYAGADLARGPLRRAVTRLRMRMRIAWRVGIFPAVWLKEGAGAYAAGLCFERGGSGEAFALLDRLIEVGVPPRPVVPANGNGNGNGHRNGNGNGNGHDRESFVRAAILGRERARTRAARESDSGNGADSDRHDDRPAVPPSSRS